jgi:hypothetical protein
MQQSPYGPPQRPGSGGSGTKVVIIVVAIVAVCVIAGAVAAVAARGGRDDDGPNNGTSNSAAYPRAGLGVPIRVGQLQYRVDSARRVQAVGSGYSTRTAPPGMVYVVVNLSVMNVSNYSRYFSPVTRMNFVTTGGQSFTYDLLGTSTYNIAMGGMSSGSISPGMMRSQGVVFSVPLAGTEAGRVDFTGLYSEGAPMRGSIDIASLPYTYQ